MAKSRKIRSIKIKVKDAAFHNTVRFGFRLVAGPLTFLLWALTSSTTFGCSGRGPGVHWQRACPHAIVAVNYLIFN